MHVLHAAPQRRDQRSAAIVKETSVASQGLASGTDRLEHLMREFQLDDAHIGTVARAATA